MKRPWNFLGNFYGQININLAAINNIIILNVDTNPKDL